MPKERLHLLLAGKSRPALLPQQDSHPADAQITRAYLLGSICPDLLFYDLPTFALSGLGNALHRFQGEAGLPFFRDWLGEESGRLAPDQKAWIFGFVNHLLADGLLHPLIERFSTLPARPCKDLGLSPKWCHHWLESELEAHWLEKFGPPDGYLPLLNAFRNETSRGTRYAAMFQSFLLRAGLQPVPSLTRIRSCLFWQTLLLSRFANAGWGKCRSWLLTKPFGRPLGTLIVPPRSQLGAALVSPDQQDQQFRVFCEAQFLEQTVTSLASHWHALAAQP